MIFSSKFRIKQCLIIYMQVNLKKWFNNYCTYKHVFLLFTAIRYPKQILVQFIIRIIKIKFLPQVCAPMRRRPVSPQSTGYWGTERRNVRPRSSRELPDTVYMPRHRRTALSVAGGGVWPPGSLPLPPGVPPHGTGTHPDSMQQGFLSSSGRGLIGKILVKNSTNFILVWRTIGLS